MTVEGMRVVVTGGTGGIGRTVVEEFIAAGARVVFCGRNEDRGRAVADALGGRAEFIRADMTKAADIARLIGSAAAGGRIDCLVNNAAEAEPVGFGQLTSDILDHAMRSVFGSVVLASQTAAETMRANGGGVIINIGSSAGRRPNSSAAVYSSLKAAVMFLTRCLAMELAPAGIRVNSVSPGAIPTPIFRDQMGLSDLPEDEALPLIREGLSRILPVGRAGTTQDIARAVLFMADPDNAYVTGTDLMVDGGLTAGNTPLARSAEWARVGEVIGAAREGR
ncbi:SDR family oxidoreductase [Streptomyces sp. NPDC046821]|uniref:SDR family NAD(P)-dependent oxidoreductase n=1 Tax=Streptomyces sp. NPDC046821 TaxID=3154702 RepID=UPI003400FC15